MLSILCVRLTIKVKVGIPESFKVGWYLPKKLGRVTLKATNLRYVHVSAIFNKVTLGSKSSKRNKTVRGRSAIRNFYTDIVILLCDVSIVSITVVRNLSLVRRTVF